MFLNMTGEQRILNYIYLFGGLINICLNYLLIPKYEMIGASISTVISLVVIKLIIIIYIKYKLDYNYSINLKAK